MKLEGTVGVDFVYATDRVLDTQLGRVVYGAGDPVPMADAVRYGLVEAAQPAAAAVDEAKPKRGARRKRADNRSRENLSEDR
jgi:hypothetical protein